ncbi:MAG: PEP/pyruvate-binding domain-containing protein [Nanoarchaeota archaeon]
MEYIIPLTKTSDESVESIGVQARDLSLLREKLFNVPPSWVLTSKGFGHFLDHNHLRPKLKQLFESVQDEAGLHSVYQMIMDLFDKAEMPADLVDELEETCVYFRKPEGLSQAKVLLDSKKRPLWLLIPSPSYSGDAEDNEGIFLNVRGLEDMVNKLKRSWASLFSPQAVMARKVLELPENLKMAVVLQQMIAVEVSGVGYAQALPKETVRLKACWGLPDYTGKISMDEYVIAMESVQITSSTVDTQLFQWGLDVHTEELIKKPVQKSSEPKLMKKEIMEFAKLTKRVRSYTRQDTKVFFLMDNQIPFICQVNRMTAEMVSKENAPQHPTHSTPRAHPSHPVHPSIPREHNVAAHHETKAEPAHAPKVESNLKSEPWLELDAVPGFMEGPKPIKIPEPLQEEAPISEVSISPLAEVKEALKDIVEESREGDKDREALLDRLLKAKELIYEIEYLMFKNDKEKFANKLGELKKLINGLE